MSFTQAGDIKPEPSVIFTKRFTDLQTAVKLSGTDLEKQGFSKWLKLYSDGTKILDGLSNDNFLKAFERKELNTTYMQTVQPGDGAPSSYRNAQVAKVRLDLLAGLERELRMRYRSRVRMIAHGAARLQSHGLGEGPILKGIMNFVTLLSDRK